MSAGRGRNLHIPPTVVDISKRDGIIKLHKKTEVFFTAGGDTLLQDEIVSLYNKFRLNTYRALFGRIREKDGSLSATEAYSVDVIYLLGDPTISELADTLGISQPNATYKVNNLAAKGYVVRVPSEDDRRECRLKLGPKFSQYFTGSTAFIDEAVEELRASFSEEELTTFENVFHKLSEIIDRR